MQRFWDKVDKNGPNGCWIWTAAKFTKKGRSGTDLYGAFGYEGKTVQAHRLAYKLLVGPIPPGAQLDHLCRVRSCVNPAHLEPVTPRENLMRGETRARANADKTHCPRGHAYDVVRKDGGRYCSACRRLSRRVGFTGWGA